MSPANTVTWNSHLSLTISCLVDGQEQVRHEPASSTAADVPGPIYEYKSTLTEMTTGFTKAPQVVSYWWTCKHLPRHWLPRHSNK